MIIISKLKAIKKAISGLFVKVFGNAQEPNLLIVGAQKSATTTLKHTLARDPLIFSPPGEAHFFDTNAYQKGYPYYFNQFKTMGHYKFVIDKTPEYLYYPFVPGRIKEYNPEQKMIVILRHPVERAFSAWNHYRKYHQNPKRRAFLIKRLKKNHGEKSKYFVELLENEDYPTFREMMDYELELSKKVDTFLEPSIVRRGIYIDQIKNYWQSFPREQLLILEQKEFREYFQENMTKVYQFMGLRLPNEQFQIPVNSNQGNYSQNKVNKKDRIFLENFYRPYNLELYDLLGRNFDW